MVPEEYYRRRAAIRSALLEAPNSQRFKSFRCGGYLWCPGGLHLSSSPRCHVESRKRQQLLRAHRSSDQLGRRGWARLPWEIPLIFLVGVQNRGPFPEPVREPVSSEARFRREFTCHRHTEAMSDVVESEALRVTAQNRLRSLGARFPSALRARGDRVRVSLNVARTRYRGDEGRSRGQSKGRRPDPVGP